MDIQHLQQTANETGLQAVFEFLSARDFHGFLTVSEVAQLFQKEGYSRIELALKLLPMAACYSHTPISHFNVGAIAIGASGNFYFGANQEFANAAMAQTIHAEQSAISHAWHGGETAITDIVVNYTPCGHCRQFMNELQGADALQIHLPHAQHNRLQSYLPDAFGPASLNVKNGLLSQENHGFIAAGDALTQAAIRAANQAHAPYSQSPHGVALEWENRHVICGRYAESAAFNPSLPALQSALNFAYLQNIDSRQIKRAVLAERANGLSHRTMSEALLKEVAGIDLEYWAL